MNQERFYRESAALGDQARKAWRDLYHLADVPHVQTRNEYEDSLFYEWLGEEYTPSVCAMLHEDVKSEFGFDWTFYQYGRGGRTIAPHEMMTPAIMSGFGGLKFEAPEDPLREGDDDEPRTMAVRDGGEARSITMTDREWALCDAYETVAALRKCVEWVEACCKAIPAEWAHYKRWAKLQRKINLMDGKKPRQVTVWR